MLALSGGHLAVDFASGSVPALIPFLTTRYGLSYTLAGLLLLAATASSSLAQPLFGLMSDRRSAVWLLPVGVALAATGVGIAAVAPSYLPALLLVLLGGLGIAAFHPEAAKCAAYASGERRATGMSYFNIGGNSGYALGALLTGEAVASVGLIGGLIAMIPVLVTAFALAPMLPQLSRLKPAVRPRGPFPEREPTRGDGDSFCGHRFAKHSLVHALGVRAALVRRLRPHQERRKSTPLPDVARRRGWHPHPGERWPTKSACGERL